MHTKFWSENLEGIDQFGGPRYRWEGDIRMDFREMVGRCGLHSPGSGWGPVSESCECANEHLGSIKGTFLTS